MLGDKHYRDRWEKEKESHADNGFTVSSGKNASGRLIVTVDGPEQTSTPKPSKSLLRSHP